MGCSCPSLLRADWAGWSVGWRLVGPRMQLDASGAAEVAAPKEQLATHLGGHRQFQRASDPTGRLPGVPRASPHEREEVTHNREVLLCAMLASGQVNPGGEWGREASKEAGLTKQVLGGGGAACWALPNSSVRRHNAALAISPR